ncbi:MAG: ABC transporter ATP-binding protein [Pleurocapsa sp. MO_192.B19]|nr:ABC transporter ATP-binding protein [Pleurocapsa sp. MO_192.B19]
MIRNLVRATSFWQDNYIILRQFKYFKFIALIAISSTLVGAFFDGVTVSLIASFLQGLTNSNEPPIQTGIAWFDVFILATKASPSKRVYHLAVVILIAIWLRSLLNYLGQLYRGLTQCHLSDRIRKLIFEQLQSLSLSYYSQINSGQPLNSITREVSELKQVFNITANIIALGSTLLAYILSLFWLSWQLSIVAVLMFSLLSVGLSNLIAKVREASFALPQANGQLTSVAIEFINGIRTVQASATQDFERRKFYQATTKVMKAEIGVQTASATIKPLAEGVSSTVLIVIVVGAFGLLIETGQIRAASLLTFMFVLFRLIPLITHINHSREKLNSFQGSIGNIKELLRSDNKKYLINGTIPFAQLKQYIEFVATDFGYDSTELVLKDINLKISKGQTTALVGASGAGKTTLVDLITRFYDPVCGKVLIDGIDLRNIDINSLRRQMGIVSQDTFIFNTSVRDNIAYGLENIDEQAIIEVAKQANAWDFIQQLPQNMDTILGDRGVRLSGGQRQRIAIARAILRNPEILILDEATSALDSVTERLIQQSLDHLTEGRTVIAIAHRLSTIVRADKVVVLKNGRIVEQGSYGELLSQRGELWKYHQMQFESVAGDIPERT